MYTPSAFRQQDQEAILALMRARPFATLIVPAGEETSVHHLPLLVSQSEDAGLVLKGHVARANPVWALPVDRAGIAVFHGPNAYISPSAYPTKKAQGRVVPTWNFLAVHATGPIRFIDDAAWKLAFLEQLTAEHEATQSAPWSVQDAPADYTRRLLEGIVGLELKVASLEGKWKLSQNQPPENQRGVLAALSGRADQDAQALARWMRDGAAGGE